MRAVRRSFLRIASLVLTAITFFHFSGDWHGLFAKSKILVRHETQEPLRAEEQEPENRKIFVSIVNTQLAHDEVLVPLMDAWLQVPDVSVSLYQAGYRFGMDDVLSKQGFPREFFEDRHVGEFYKIGQDADHPLPDIVVLTTCMNDILPFTQNFTNLLENYHTHFFCVVHHADRLDNNSGPMEDLFTPWIRAERMDIITLSPHVSESAQRVRLQHWPVVRDEGHQPPLRCFPPVFTFTNSSASKGVGRQAGFSIQGDYQRGRDFEQVFFHLQSFILEAKARGESADEINLHLVGFGKHPEVPKALQKNVIFDERLDYIDFYTTLMQTEAIIPAFVQEEYYTLKASSSVPASLISGTALIANKKLLDAYAYLSPSAVWWQDEGESEFDVVGKVFAMSPEERAEKKRAVQELRDGLIDANRRNVIEWTRQAVAKFPFKEKGAMAPTS